MRNVILTLCVLLLLGVAGGAAVVYGGLYPVEATRPHVQAVHSVLEITMRQAVRRSARDIEVPPLDDHRLVQRGAGCFRDKCVQCHGAPGVAQGEIGQGMQPLPGPLVDARQHWQPRELYWIVKHGIRMSGMPAWEYRLADQDLWALVAFMQALPDMTPQAYAETTRHAAPGIEGGGGYSPIDGGSPRVATCGFTAAQRDQSPQRAADADRGKIALSQYACIACHTVPGVTSSSPQVGPPLAGMASRTRIAGRLPNTRDNMVRWLRAPREVDPLTAMPDLRVSETDARDLAAYLETLY
jgi:mono/diheme cytochrome c family protein